MLIIVGLYIIKRVTGTDALKTIVMSKPVVVALTAMIDAVCKLIPNKT